MKIALFYNLPAGGAKRTVYEQVKYLSKANQIDLFELSSTMEEFKDIRPYCHRTYRFRFEYHRNYFLDLFNLVRAHKRIAAKINAGNYDVALVHSDEYSGAPFLLRFLKIPKLYFCQEYLRIGYEEGLAFKDRVGLLKKVYETITRQMRKTVDKNNARAATAILTNSRFSQNNIFRAYSRQTVVCHLGVDHAVFKPIKTKKLNQVLFIGSPTKVKGYNLAVKSLSLIEENIRPRLILLNAYSKAIINNDSEMAKIYSQSIATMCLSYREPFGLSAIESMACGTPAIAVNEGGYKETVPKDFLLKKSPVNIADKIISLIKNPQTVSTNFSWDKHNQVIEGQLQKLSQPKILISGQDSGGMGGSEKFLLDLADELKNKNNEVEFLTVNNSKFSTVLRKAGYQPFTIPVRMDILGWWKGLIKFIIFLPASLTNNYFILRKYKEDRPAKIIISGFSDKLILSPVAKLLGYKVIWIEYAPLKPVFSRNLGIPKILYRYTLCFADKVVCPTRNTYKSLIEESIFDRRKLQIIPVGIKIIDVRSRNKSSKKRMVVGMVSRIEEGKGQDTLIEAAKILRDKTPNLQIFIIGEGEKKLLIDLISKYQLQKVVKLVGYQENVYDLMKNFDVCVFPTRWPLEGFGLVCLEAMMLKIPLVASNFGPVPEVVGDCAVLVSSKPRALAQGILKIVNNPKLASSLVVKGYRRVNKYFNIEEVAGAYEKI
jgi:glycosyltransferase involved in cell wall biosynthesis